MFHLLRLRFSSDIGRNQNSYLLITFVLLLSVYKLFMILSVLCTPELLEHLGNGRPTHSEVCVWLAGIQPANPELALSYDVICAEERSLGIYRPPTEPTFSYSLYLASPQGMLVSYLETIDAIKAAMSSGLVKQTRVSELIQFHREIQKFHPLSCTF